MPLWPHDVTEMPLKIFAGLHVAFISFGWYRCSWNFKCERKKIINKKNWFNMASKRKFCEQCEEYVTLRTQRLHTDLYFKDVNVDRNMGHEADDQGIEATSQGTKRWWTKFLCILAIKCNLSNHFVVLPIFYPKTVLYSGYRHWICFFVIGAWIQDSNRMKWDSRFFVPNPLLWSAGFWIHKCII